MHQLSLKWLIGLAMIMAYTILFTGMVNASSQSINDAVLTTEEYSVFDSRIIDMENRINDLNSRLDMEVENFNETHNGAALGSIAILFGSFCALWAQNTKRNATAWFFLGLIFTFIAAFAVLWKNHDDLNKELD
ncbi:MAG: hypothetical protein ACM3QW_06530 [Ignavibacteriales bacterium]